MGDYWEVTGIKIVDGAGLKYGRHLAGEWRVLTTPKPPFAGIGRKCRPVVQSERLNSAGIG